MNTTTYTPTVTELTELLSKNICTIEFTKVNGEKRIMPCTLRTDIVPPTIVKEGKAPKKHPDNIMNVWCIDKKEWRSFRIENLVSVEVKND